jgi:adenylylsulfate reductase subunit B
MNPKREVCSVMKLEYKYRGGIKIDYSRCKGCGACYEACPADIFSFDPESKLLTVEYPEECWYCGICIFECPVEGALQLEMPMACL